MPSNSRAILPSAHGGLLAVLTKWLLAEARFVAKLLRWFPAWLLVVLVLTGAVVAYQAPRTYTVNVGAPQDQAYTRNFHTRLDEDGHNYRWSDVYGYVLFPGIGGSRPFTLTVTLDPAHSAPVGLFINGERFLQQTLEPGWQTLTFRVDEMHPAALASRDTVVEFRAPDYRTEDAPTEPKGIKVGAVTLEQARTGGFITPSLATLGYIALSVLLVYLLVGRLLMGVATLGSLRWRALFGGGLAVVGLWVTLFVDRMAVSAAVPHLVITLASGLVLLILTQHLVSVWRPKLSHGHALLLGAAVALAFILRYGGMALPQAVIIDMPYHMKWLRTLLTGDWQSLYFPGGLSAVPREWGLSLLIPKSPLFYIAFAPLDIIPFDLETLVKWLISVLDSSIILPLYWFATRLSGSSKSALLSSAVYAAMPLVFRAFAYGILPTIFAQWLATILLAGVLVVANVRWRWPVWVGLLVMAFSTLLAFPTVAVFVTIILAVAPVLWWYSAHTRPSATFQWRPYLLVTLAWIASLWLYYGLYISPVIASAQALLAPSQGGGTTVHWPGGPLQLLGWTADYVVTLLPYILAAAGVALVMARGSLSLGRKQALGLLLAWLAIAPLFIVANYKVDMIGKHLFFIMVPVAVTSGVALWSILRRGGWGACLTALLLMTVGWQALVFWVERLVRASS